MPSVMGLKLNVASDGIFIILKFPKYNSDRYSTYNTVIIAQNILSQLDWGG